MYTFHSIKELLNALMLGRDLLTDMFGKRKLYDYQYQQAIEIIEESKVESLIDKGILIQNGSHLEIDDELLSFLEQLLDVNEEINTSLIDEQLAILEENIDYFLTETSEYRQHRYLTKIKRSLKKIGLICLRNIVDLNRNIDNAFKTEPNYKIKIKKLENYDQRRLAIKTLISTTEELIIEDQSKFFAKTKDEELIRVTTNLRLQLQEARHNIIETEKQIIDFLNQVKHQSRVVEKIRQIKYLKDQFELESKSDIVSQLGKMNPVAFEPKPLTSLKLSLDLLQEDETFELIKELNQKFKSSVVIKIPLAKPIDTAFFDDTEETDQLIDLEQMKTDFLESPKHLLDFVMHYHYPREVSFEEKVTSYCQLISLYEDDLKITDAYITEKQTEFSVVYNNQK